MTATVTASPGPIEPEPEAKVEALSHGDVIAYLHDHDFPYVAEDGPTNRGIKESCSAIDRMAPGSGPMRRDRQLWLDALVDSDTSVKRAHQFVDVVFEGCYETGHAVRWVRPEPEPRTTFAQQNLIGAAEQYLDSSAFSRQGLIDQLSSPYGGQFSVADATFAVDNITVSWNAQAIRAAEQYLESTAFSRQGLIDQLSSAYGGQFTVEQAVYGVSRTGL